MNRPTTIPVDGPMQLGIDRHTMRRRVTASLLRHGRDGVWTGLCYCGSPHGDSAEHRVREVAAETGLDEAYVREVFTEHRSAAGNFGGDMRCCCGTTYVDRGYGGEQHLAEALAAGCSREMLRDAAARRYAVSTAAVS